MSQRKTSSIIGSGQMNEHHRRTQVSILTIIRLLLSMMVYQHCIRQSYHSGLSRSTSSKMEKGTNGAAQKIVGNNYIHKLRELCLFETNFNWWNKLVFARQMMMLAGEKRLIPGDLL